MNRKAEQMTAERYTFNTAPNAYYLGADLRVTNISSGETIRLNIKDGLWAIDVKDHGTFHTMPQDARKAAEQLGEEATQRIYDEIRDGFWLEANNRALASGFSEVFSAGHSGGWLAVAGTSDFDLSILLNPDEPIDEDDAAAKDLADRFLHFAFQTVASIEDFRNEFHAALLTEAAQPQQVQIMVLSDGETFSPLAGCKIIEVPADLDTDGIEALLADNPRVVRTFP